MEADSVGDRQRALDELMRTRREELEQDLLQSYLEDLAFWVGDLCEIPEIDADNLIECLEDGTLMGQVAGIICDAETKHLQENDLDDDVAWKRPRYNKRAKRGTFFARDNISTFIAWARDFGVPESALFETSDLVAHTNLKLVLYTLMDVARCSHLELHLLPQLIQLEREIDDEEDLSDEEEEEELEMVTRVKPTIPTKPRHLSKLNWKQPNNDEPEPEAMEIVEVEFTPAVTTEEPQEVKTSYEVIEAPPSTQEVIVVEIETVTPEPEIIIEVIEPIIELPQQHEQEQEQEQEVVVVVEVEEEEEVAVEEEVEVEVEDEVAVEEEEAVVEEEEEVVQEHIAVAIEMEQSAPEIEDEQKEEVEEEQPLVMDEVQSVEIEQEPAQEQEQEQEQEPEQVEDEEEEEEEEEETFVPEPEPEVIKFVKGDEIDEMVQTMALDHGRVKLKRIRKGKYQISNTKKNLFVRILRNHIMVRVGGGWDTFEHYLMTHRDAHSHLNNALFSDNADGQGDLARTSNALRSHAKGEKTRTSKLQRTTTPLFKPAKKAVKAGQVKFRVQNDEAARQPNIGPAVMKRKEKNKKLLASPFMPTKITRGKSALNVLEQSNLVPIDEPTKQQHHHQQQPQQQQPPQQQRSQKQQQQQQQQQSQQQKQTAHPHHPHQHQHQHQPHQQQQQHKSDHKADDVTLHHGGHAKQDTTHTTTNHHNPHTTHNAPSIHTANVLLPINDTNTNFSSSKSTDITTSHSPTTTTTSHLPTITTATTTTTATATTDTITTAANTTTTNGDVDVDNNDDDVSNTVRAKRGTQAESEEQDVVFYENGAKVPQNIIDEVLSHTDDANAHTTTANTTTTNTTTNNANNTTTTNNNTTTTTTTNTANHANTATITNNANTNNEDDVDDVSDDIHITDVGNEVATDVDIIDVDTDQLHDSDKYHTTATPNNVSDSNANINADVDVVASNNYNDGGDDGGDGNTTTTTNANTDINTIANTNTNTNPITNTNTTTITDNTVATSNHVVGDVVPQNEAPPVARVVPGGEVASKPNSSAIKSQIEILRERRKKRAESLLADPLAVRVLNVVITPDLDEIKAPSDDDDDVAEFERLEMQVESPPPPPQTQEQQQEQEQRVIVEQENTPESENRQIQIKTASKATAKPTKRKSIVPSLTPKTNTGVKRTSLPMMPLSSIKTSVPASRAGGGALSTAKKSLATTSTPSSRVSASTSKSKTTSTITSTSKPTSTSTSTSTPKSTSTSSTSKLARSSSSERWKGLYKSPEPDSIAKTKKKKPVAITTTTKSLRKTRPSGISTPVKKKASRKFVQNTEC